VRDVASIFRDRANQTAESPVRLTAKARIDIV